MRILTVIAEMRTGGAQAVVAALAEDGLACGDDVVLASHGGWLADRLTERGVVPLTLSLDGRRTADLMRATATLRRHLHDSPPDIVHTHNVKATLVARLARDRGGPPIVTTLHGVADRDYRASARVLRHCSDAVVAVSDHVAARLTAAGFPAHRVTVVENAVTPVPVLPRAEARRRLGLSAEAPVAVCAARLVEQKRHDLLIEAWRSAPTDAILLLAGDGPNRAALTEAVHAAGLTDRVRLLGERRDVEWLLAAADLAVLPTDWEGLPISLLEAMSAGVPVLASKVGGVVDALGDAAELVEPGSAAALAEGICRMLSADGYRAKLRERGRRLVTERFAPQRMLAGYRDMYASVLPVPLRSAS